jgi:hypothetical protein
LGTLKIGYCTKRAFDWRRHEETHEPNVVKRHGIGWMM